MNSAWLDPDEDESGAFEGEAIRATLRSSLGQDAKITHALLHAGQPGQRIEGFDELADLTPLAGLSLRSLHAIIDRSSSNRQLRREAAEGPNLATRMPHLDPSATERIQEPTSPARATNDGRPSEPTVVEGNDNEATGIAVRGADPLARRRPLAGESAPASGPRAVEARESTESQSAEQANPASTYRENIHESVSPSSEETRAEPETEPVPTAQVDNGIEVKIGGFAGIRW